MNRHIIIYSMYRVNALRTPSRLRAGYPTLHREPNLKFRLGTVNNIKYLGDLTELTPSASEGVQNI